MIDISTFIYVESFVSELDLRVLSRHNTLKETNRNLALHGLSTYQENALHSSLSENEHILGSPVQESSSSSCFFSALDVNSLSPAPVEPLSTSAFSINSHISLKSENTDVSNSTIFSGRKALFEDDRKSFRKNRSIGLSQRSITNIKSGMALFHLIDDDEEDNVKGSTNTEVWSWGKNAYGQLGLGDLNNRLVF